MAEIKKSIGLDNSWIVYIIGTMSLLEACIFLILNYLMLVDLDLIRDLLVTADMIWWVLLEVNMVRRITIFCLGVQGFRLLCALVFILGRMKGSLKITAVFCFFSLIGIVGNLATGILLVQHHITQRIAISSLAMIAIHIIYIVVCFKIFRQEHISKICESQTSNIPQHQAHYIASSPVPVQYQSTFPAEATGQSQPTTPVQTPERIENMIPTIVPIDPRRAIEHEHDSPQPVVNYQYENVYRSQNGHLSIPFEPPPNYEECATGHSSQAADTKQDIEDMPPKVYI